jgi:ankyrin repeat protein
MSTIFKCAQRNDLPSLQRLLKYNYPLDSVTFDDESILHLAAERGSLDILKFGITSKLDVNACTHSCHETPLHLAVQENQKEAVITLLDSGSDPKIENIEVSLFSFKVPLLFSRDSTLYSSPSLSR